MGFIETPYHEVKDGKVDMNNEPIYLTAEEEEERVIAQAMHPFRRTVLLAQIALKHVKKEISQW
jgi:DNA-directed RNA polymerase beta subunit